MSTSRPWFRVMWLVFTCLLTISFSSLARAQVVISEVDYDQPGADNAEWIELKNVGASPVSLNGYALAFVNGANGTFYNGGAAGVALPNVSVPAGGYFVVCANPATTPGCNFDAPGAATDWIQNGAPDAIALQLNSVVQDVVSYEGNTTNFTEGTGESVGDDNVNLVAMSRCPDGTDTGNNDADFAIRPPTLGAANDCGGGGGVIGACGDSATLISAVQGPGATTPMSGAVVNVEGVLVGDFQLPDPAIAPGDETPLNGFYLQEEDSQHDASSSTSEGIFIAEGALVVSASVGNLVRVRGVISEASAVTQLAATAMLVCPGSPVASTVPISLPFASIAGTESLEGMRVSISQQLTVTGIFELGRFGSLDLSVNGRLFEPTHLALPGAPALAQADLNNRSRVILDDLSNRQNPTPIPYKDANNTRRVGDTLPSLEGIFEDRFNALRIRPTGTPVFSAGNPRPATPPAVAGRLKVAALNVLNYFTTLDSGAAICGPTGGLDCRGANNATEFSRQRVKTLNALEALNGDVVGLIEIENNPSAATQDLVNGLNDRFGAGTYQFIDTGTIGTDAIKQAIVYKPAKVTPAGSHAVLTSAFDPDFIDNKNRPSLAQTFIEVATGARFTVVVNHLKSKGSACDDVGDPDVGDGQGNCNLTRADAAAVLADWIATNPTGQGNGNYLLVGDFNAYAKEDPIQVLKGAGLVALIENMLGTGAYSYQFAGESGYLDSALATASLATQVAGVVEWHANADEPVVLDYNLEFKTDDPFNPADPFRSSDHDAVIVGLNLQSVAAAPASGLGSLGLLAGLLLAASFWRRRGVLQANR